MLRRKARSEQEGKDAVQCVNKSRGWGKVKDKNADSGKWKGSREVASERIMNRREGPVGRNMVRLQGACGSSKHKAQSNEHKSKWRWG